MVDDLTEKAQASMGKLEALMAKIPGIAGYQQKEKRRDADKLLRLHIARLLEEQMSRLSEVQYKLTMQGRLDATLLLERATTKLQLLIDRLKMASYGYSGFFDAVKVDEDALDKLYRFDEQMLDSVDELCEAISQLAEGLEREEPIMTQSNALVRLIEGFNGAFSKRQDVLLG